MAPTMTPASDRSALRTSLRAARRALAPRERLLSAEAIATHLLQLPAVSDAAQVAGYWAVDGELSLHAVMPQLAPMAYCLPCIEPDSSLTFARWQVGAPLAPNRFGIPEPADSTRLPPQQMDVVLLPLVGFDRQGNRLGSGAGFYDRSFAFLQGVPRPARPLLVGIAYAAQEVPALAAEHWDVPLDLVVTERELIRCLPALA
jgi:5-formyltetrahydrofolate cyclo-ligase